MDKKFRWGIIGTGYIARTFAKALTYIPDAETYAVGSRTIESAATFAKNLNVPKVYDTYQGVVDDPDVDAVYIATVNSLHKQNCIDAINAGKPVLCEKPFMLNSEEAKEVITLAREKKVFLMEALWTRYIPAFQKARQMWEDGVIGDVYSATSDIGWVYERDETHPLYQPALGGGSLLDLGAYPVSIAHIVFGEPDTISSFGFVGPLGVDEQNGIVFGYKGGQLALGYSSFKVSPPMEATICGSKGYIRFNSPFYCPSSFMLRLNDQEPQLFEVPYEGNGWNYEAVEVMECLRQGKLESELASHEDTLALMRTMDRIREQMGLRFPTEK
jgi:dihydrodiol dehydrogenase / D-xylose 1-dehydrogenase (NADP)